MRWVQGFGYAFRRLYRLGKKSVLVMVFALLLGIPVISVELWFVKRLADTVQSWHSGMPIGPLLALAGVMALLMLLNNIILGAPVPLAMTRLMELDEWEVPSSILHKTSRLPLGRMESPAVANLRERAGRASHFEVYDAGLQGLKALLVTALLSAMLLAYGRWVAVVAVLVATLILAVGSRQAAGGLERLARNQAADRRLLRHYAGLMTRREAAKEVRLFGLGDALHERWAALSQRMASDDERAVRDAVRGKLAPELLMALLGGALVALLVLFPGSQSVGDFSLQLLALTMLFTQLQDLIGQVVKLHAGIFRLDDLRRYLELAEDDPGEEKEGDSGWQATRIGLEVRSLGFRYPGTERPVLEEIVLTIPPGCRAALVGENGSGKSTLVKLLTGLYVPTSGSVEWFGEGGERLAKGEQRESFSAVFQDFAKLYLTLRENVALGKLSAMHDDASLRKALQAIGGEGIAGLDAQLGAAFGGMEPSGGQWQRIVTARALLRSAGFVFFDEPTAALDPQAEKEAFQLFLKVTEGRSALIVTHRLGAARRADVIFVLKAGRLVEKGNHEELMRLGGTYSRMFRTQAAWYGEEGFGA